MSGGARREEGQSVAGGGDRLCPGPLPHEHDGWGLSSAHLSPLGRAWRHSAGCRGPEGRSLSSPGWTGREGGRDSRSLCLPPQATPPSPSQPVRTRSSVRGVTAPHTFPADPPRNLQGVLGAEQSPGKQRGGSGRANAQ